jgi:hypothetical protein
VPQPLQATQTPATTTRQLLEAIKGLHARLDRLDARLDQVLANQGRQTELLAADCARFINELKGDLFRVYEDLDRDGGTNLPFGPVGPSEFELVGDRLRGRRGAWVPGEFAHASVGLDDTLWALTDGDEIRRWDARTGAWQTIPGGLVCVSAPTAGIVWGVARDETIYRWDGADWQQVPGRLVWISAAADGTVVGCANDQTLWRLVGADHWEQLPGLLVRVAARSATEMIGVAAGDEIFVWGGEGWVRVAGLASEVAVGDGYDGGPVYYVANREGRVYRTHEAVPSAWGVVAEGAHGISAAGGRLVIRRGVRLYADPEI